MDTKHATLPTRSERRQRGFSLIEADDRRRHACDRRRSGGAQPGQRLIDGAPARRRGDRAGRRRPVRPHRSGRAQPAAAHQLPRRAPTAACWVVHTGARGAVHAAPTRRPPLCSRRRRSRSRRVVLRRRRPGQRRRPTSPRSPSTRCTARARRPARCASSTRRGRAVHHVVNVMGRVRSCTPGRAVPGYARLLNLERRPTMPDPCAFASTFAGRRAQPRLHR